MRDRAGRAEDQQDVEQVAEDEADEVERQQHGQGLAVERDPDEVLQAPEPRDDLAGGGIEREAGQEPDVEPQHPPAAQGELGEAVRPGEALDEGHGGRLPPERGDPVNLLGGDLGRLV